MHHFLFVWTGPKLDRAIRGKYDLHSKKYFPSQNVIFHFFSLWKRPYTEVHCILHVQYMAASKREY